MKLKKLAITVLSAMLITGSMAGCGEYKMSSEAVADYKEDNGWGYAAATEEAAMEAPAEAAAGAASSQADLLSEEGQASASDQAASDIQRKLIRNMDFTLETTEFDSLLDTVEKKVAEAGGYVESSNIDGTSDSGRRHAYINARIPAEQLDAFADMLGNTAVVVSKSTNVRDVTLSYTDLAAHVSALRTEQQTLTEMLAKAEDMESIIIIQNELTNIRYELESYESQLRVMDNQVSYSTVYMNIREVKTPTAQVKDGFGARLSRTFRNSLNGLGEGIVDFLVFFLGNLPGILVFVVVVYIIFRVIRFLFRRIFRKGPKGPKPPKMTRAQRKAAAQYKAQAPVQNMSEAPMVQETLQAPEAQKAPEHVEVIRADSATDAKTPEK